MTEVTWENGDYLDGPTLAEWLEPRLPALVRVGRDPQTESALSALRRWRNGGAATHLGFHLSEVPDEAWRKGEPYAPFRKAVAA